MRSLGLMAGKDEHRHYLLLALGLARRGLGTTSPNPMVGAVLVKKGVIIGRGFHRRAGEPHAEVEALRDAQRRGRSPKGATLYVTLEPCCTQGRTPPCTDSILAAGIKKVVTGASDPNPRHCGRGLAILEKGGVEVVSGVLGEECERLNEAFSHWIVHRSPWVTVKSAMTLDGKIATAAGESKWITGERARAYGMRLRQETDAILVGINTILADDPSLTFRPSSPRRSGTGLKPVPPERGATNRRRRIILDARGRTPLTAKVVSDSHAGLTTIVLSKLAPQGKRNALSKKVQVLVAPLIEAGRSGKEPRLDLRWVLKELGSQQVTSLIVEGGGEVNASFLLQGLAHRVACFYAPMVLGGRDARPAVGGQGATRLEEAVTLTDVRWRRLGPDWLLTARVER